jgi:DNA-directed RNA polymerase sigma subunit (sigma70/sigma32)
MDQVRAAAVGELRLALEQIGDLRKRLQTTERTFVRAIRRVEDGTPIIEVLDAIRADLIRTELNESLTEMELRRRTARRSMLVAGLAEGHSLAELGRAMGISRQLASRLAAEDDGEPAGS